MSKDGHGNIREQSQPQGGRSVSCDPLMQWHPVAIETNSTEQYELISRSSVEQVRQEGELWVSYDPRYEQLQIKQYKHIGRHVGKTLLE